MSLIQITTIAELHAYVASARAQSRTVGLVPTMGALHEGHESLIRAARTKTDVVITTIFVNPLQFAPTEDLAAYPRDLEGDAMRASSGGADVLFTPSVSEMYPHGAGGTLTSVSVRELTDVLEGARRPGHFDGVATVVAKLFAMTGACAAFFGEKDFQQLAVIKRMCADLSFPVEVIGCPTVREANGLALSSRNRYLTDDERGRASILSSSLRHGANLIAAGESSVAVVEQAMQTMARTEPLVELDYGVVVDPDTLRAPESIAGELRLLMAARVGRARLIDNIAAISPLKKEGSND